MISYEELKRLQILQAGVAPQWTVDSTQPYSPPAGDDGVALDGAVVALIGVALDNATTVETQLWVRANNVWFPAAAGIFLSPFMERAWVAGFERIYLQITNADGDVDLHYGPCFTE